jgi:integrase
MPDNPLRRFLDVFDPSNPTGCRDHAMARCQVDLGLRVGEVAALRLEDLDRR